MTDNNHIYDTNFYDYIEKGSRDSAKVFIPLLTDQFEISSLLDIGCGRGAWLSEWQMAGVTDILGVDGGYVDSLGFHVDASKYFRPHNLTSPFDFQRKFDICQCLEVAEHLPRESSELLIKSIVKHADIIVFSAAQPGQGGESHINEQPLSYWRSIFSGYGYEPYDFLRSKIESSEKVMPWYKYNTILYANTDGRKKLSSEIIDAYVPPTERLFPGGSLSWRLRRFVVGLLPRTIVDFIAVKNSQRVATKR